MSGDSTRPAATGKKRTAEKAAEMREAAERRDRRRRLLFWGGVAAAVLVLGGAVAFGLRAESAGKDLSGVQTFPVKQGHVTSEVTYAQSPPVGGEHAPVWLNCGVYDVPVPKENAVHSLEHGAVWVTYRPDLPADQVSRLTDLLQGPYHLLSPMPGLSAPVVASAWGKQLTLTGADDTRLAPFLKAYTQGPQSPEPGASCTGGTDGTTPAPGQVAPTPGS